MTQRIDNTVDTELKAIYRKRPKIDSEVDAPFPENEDSEHFDDSNLNRTITIRDQSHKHEIDSFKHKLAQKIIYFCLAVVVTFAVVDAFFHVDSELFRSAFDMLKLVSMTALGFLFGVNTQK